MENPRKSCNAVFRHCICDSNTGVVATKLHKCIVTVFAGFAHRLETSETSPWFAPEQHFFSLYECSSGFCGFVCSD